MWINSVDRRNFKAASYRHCHVGISVNSMKIYNEKEQVEQGKVLEEQKDTRKWNGAK